MKKAVLDCNILLQAATAPSGPAVECLRRLQAGKFQAFASAATMAEIQDVLTRAKIRRKYASLTDDWIEEFLGIVNAISEFVPDVPHRFDYPRDPKDEPYIDLAIECDADFIVSRDNDLLDLTRDKSFAASFPDLVVCNPEQFLLILDSI